MFQSYKKLLYCLIFYSQVTFTKDLSDNFYTIDNIYIKSKRLNVDNSAREYDRDFLNKSQANDIRSSVRYIPSVSTLSDGFGRDQNYNIRGMEQDRTNVLIDGNTLGQIINGMGFGNKESVRNGIEFDTIKYMNIIKGPFSVKDNSIGGIVNLNTYNPEDFLEEKNFYLGLKEFYSQSNSKYKSTFTLADKINNFKLLLMITGFKNRQIKNFDDKDNSSFEFGEIYPQSPLDAKGHNILGKISYDLGNSNKFLFSINNYYDNYKLHDKYDSSGRRVARYNLNYINEVNNKYIKNYEIKLSYNYIKDKMSSEFLIPLFYIKNPIRNLNDRLKYFKNVTNYILDYIPDNLSLYKQDVFMYQENYGISFDLYGKFNTYYSDHNWSLGFNYLQDSFTRNPLNKGINEIVPLSFDTLPKLKDKDFNIYVNDNIIINDIFSLGLSLKYKDFVVKPFSSAYLNYISTPIDVLNIDKNVRKKSLKDLLPIIYLRNYLNDNNIVYFQYSKGIKNPVYNNYITFNHGFSWILPNSNLKEEKSNNFELGHSYFGEKLNSNLDFFINKYKNFIEYQRFYRGYKLYNIPIISNFVKFANKISDNDSLKRQYRMPVNISKVRTYGMEFSFDYILNKNFSINFASSFIKGKNLITKNNLTSISPYKTILGIDYHYNNIYGISIDWTHSGKVKKVPIISSGEMVFSSSERFKAPRYNIFDLTFWTNISKNITLSGGIYNITNKKYWLSQDVQNLKANRKDLDKFTMPRRNFILSLMVKL